MIGRLRDWLSAGPLYVRIWSDRLSVRDVGSGRVFDDEPVLALEHEPPHRVQAVGGQQSRQAVATHPGLELVNPFDHPRSLLDDFTVAERLLQYAFREVLGRGAIRPAPLVVMHPLEKLEGGLTVVERRAFQELALAAGARKVAVVTGEELSDAAVRDQLKSR